MAEPRFKPRIDDRHDRLIFMLASFGGGTAIITTRIIGSEDPLFKYFAILIAVGVIISYTAYILFSKDRSSISLDRAGDNAYYLGLIFTLISLGYSLWKLAGISVTGADGGTDQSAERVLGLLPDFGLALASTIVGIFCRVFVQQFRNDPADVETQARYELGLAVRELRASLLQAASDMNNTSRTTTVALAEMSTRINETLEVAARENLGAMSRITKKVEELANHFLAQVRPISDGLKRVAEEVGAAASQLREQAAEFNSDRSSVERGLKALSTELSKLCQQMEATRGISQTFSNELSGLTDRFSKVLSEEVVTKMQSAESEVLEGQGRLVSKLGTLEDDVTRIGQNLSGISDRVSGATESLEQVGVANKMLSSQLEDARSQLVDSQQKLLSDYDSLENRVRQADPESPSLKRWLRRWFQ
jgi:archaellum component FlaC